MANFIIFVFLLTVTIISGAILKENNSHYIEYRSNNKNHDDTLVLLHVLFRHGNRTPDKGYGYVNDPYANETYYPIGHGQLTTAGKKTAYKIGSYLRKKYDDYLGKQYTPNIVHSRCSNFKRTKMTLQLVLASLYPPTKDDIFKDGLYWQPIPYVYEPLEDYLLGIPRFCLYYSVAYGQYQISNEANKQIEPYRDLYQKLSHYSGNDVRFPSDVLKIYATLQSEEEWGLDLPPWTEEFYPKILEEASSVDYIFQTATRYLRQMSSGFLLRKIVEDTQAKIDGKLDEDIKVFLYSAHEFNVATMLRTLDVFFPHVPPFGATIILEVHRINRVYGIKIYYQDYSSRDPKLLTIPGCKSFCPFDTFVQLVANNLPTEASICASAQEL